VAVTENPSDMRQLMAGQRASAPDLGIGLPIVVWLYLLAVVIPIGFWAGPLFMTTLRLLVMVMVIPLMLKILMGHYGKVFVTDYLFIFFVLWTAVALAANNPDQVIQQVGSTGPEFLGGYAIGRAYIRTPAQFMALCRVLVIIVLCTLPFSIFEAVTGRPIVIEIMRKVPGMQTVGVVTIEGRMGLERVQSMFAHPIHYGLFCSVALSLCFVALKGLMSTTKRFVFSVAIAFSGFLALSSGAITAIAMQVALITWAAMFKNLSMRWWLLIGIFAFGYVTIDLLSDRSPIKVFMSYAAFSAHNAFYRSIIFDWGIDNIFGNAARGIPGSPIFGIGNNHWIRPHYMFSGTVDNFWLLMGMRYGVPGFLFLAGGYIVIIAKAMRRNFEGNERLILLRRAWVFTFLGLTFTLCTVHVWSNIYSFIFFMFGAGVWLVNVASDAGLQGTAPDDGDDAAPGGGGQQGRGGPDGTRRFTQRPSGANRFSRFPKRERATGMARETF